MSRIDMTTANDEPCAGCGHPLGHERLGIIGVPGTYHAHCLPHASTPSLLATARADGRREGLEKTHAHLVGAIAAEEFLRDVARRARDNEDALIHGYAADALRQSATAIRAMMEKE